MEFPHEASCGAVATALREDEVGADLTTVWSVPADRWASARIVARRPGVVAGVPVLSEVFAQVDPEVTVTPACADGAVVKAGSVVAEVAGLARSLISGERVALNFLQRMSGIATLTREFVSRVGTLPVKVLDTRKTAPGLRRLDKYAVALGGGSNHRMDLAAMVLIKDNHLAAAGGVTAAVAAVQRGMDASGSHVPIEVEVTTLAQAREALDQPVEWIMLDNMPLARMRRVVQLRDVRSSAKPILLEASGTISLRQVRAVAETGVDAISVGALTHSPAALDLSMLIADTLNAPAAPSGNQTPRLKSG